MESLPPRHLCHTSRQHVKKKTTPLSQIANIKPQIQGIHIWEVYSLVKTFLICNLDCLYKIKRNRHAVENSPVPLWINKPSPFTPNPTLGPWSTIVGTTDHPHIYRRYPLLIGGLFKSFQSLSFHISALQWSPLIVKKVCTNALSPCP